MAADFYLHVGELELCKLITVHSTAVRGGIITVSVKVYNSPLTWCQFLITFPVTGVEVSAGPGNNS